MEGRLTVWLKLLRLFGRHFPVARGKGRVAKWAFRTLPIQNRTIPVTIESGIELELRPWLWPDFCTYAIGTPEPYHLAYFKSVLQPTATVFDIGAYIGVYSFAACSRVTEGSIHIFEPNPDSAERIREAIEHNRLANFHLNHCAVGARPGRRRLNLHPIPTQSSLAAIRNGRESVAIDVQTVDDYCAAKGISRIDVMKVDVEGAEFDVLQGALESLKRWRPIAIIELHRREAASFGHPVEETLGLLTHLDYSLFELKHGFTLKPKLLPLKKTGWLRKILIARSGL